MDKNSLIQDIKNDLNSIKKQVEVTLAKLEVLEAMCKLDEAKVGTLGSSVRDSEPQPVELGLKEPIVEPEPVVEEPVVEPVQQPIAESEPVVEPEPIVEPEPELVLEVEKEEVAEPTPNSEESTPISEAPAELRNLMSVIGLNDRFRFRHDLFSDSNDLFKETIEILNAIENFDKAVDYLQEKFNWDEEDATVVYFYDIIKPKF
jgi:hypothetical protein